MGPEVSDSQADSEGSIPVTRSSVKPQVSGSRWPLAPDRSRGADSHAATIELPRAVTAPPIGALAWLVWPVVGQAGWGRRPGQILAVRSLM